ERLTFRGLEKNATTIRLAKMNLAVHGLEGDIQKAITYYEDPHELVGKSDFVMANPPFNVDEIDADKVKTDPRLPFGLPGVNKKGKVSNGNYVWISYFYSYLNEHGRAGFVMSSQASSAGGGEAKVRRKLVESGDVDVMVAIRSNFFYTRTVPCELWFLNRDKPDAHGDKVLMIDARNVYRKVTRKIYDFSPEQRQNLLAIVWLYRGQTDRYLELVSGYCLRTLNEGAGCFKTKKDNGDAILPLSDFTASLKTLTDTTKTFINTLSADAAHTSIQVELTKALPAFQADVAGFKKALSEQEGAWKKQKTTNGALKKAVDRLAPLAETSRNLVKQSDLTYKLASRLVDALQQTPSPQPSPSRRAGNHAALRKILRALDVGRQLVVEQLRQVRYFWKQARWLTERFPDAELRDVDGLVKLVDLKEIEANDWSLTPGRYVGVAPEEEDEDFDFEETLREIHVELEDLNAEAVTLAATIKKNFAELGV
ncbi:MAG: N-6 DNA methylase, partial [Deltaproteobacteria bacterium]|nr:N-6 DNA methylase [Deltaproteobacteria bacterium]